MLMPASLENISENGIFEFKNSDFFSENIKNLIANVRQFKQNNSSFPLHLRLKNIQMIPDAIQRKQDMGPPIKHVSRPWKDRYSDVAIVRMGAVKNFNFPMNYADIEEVIWHPPDPESPFEILQKLLLSLLSQSWSSIELVELSFCSNCQIDERVTQEFYSKLLNSLARNSDLKELIISPFSLTKQQLALIPFLSNTKLEYLHLDITQADRFSWEEFCRSLHQSPTLKSLNLGNSALDSCAYKTLAMLLDKNYKIKITVSEPTNLELLSAYQPLKRRLTKSGLERFKERHLTQEKLFQVAIDTLESLKLSKLALRYPPQHKQFEKLFDRLINNQTAFALIQQEKSYVEALPSIYRNHCYLFNEEDPVLVQLSIDTLVKNSIRSRGSILLEKALETNNQKVLQTLLDANANLFEFPPHQEEPFLVKILQNSGVIKKLVLDHIREKNQLEEFDLLQLRVAQETKTIGYVLLKKALKNNNIKRLRHLLRSNADLFEFPKNEQEPFLVKVFQSQGELKNCVVDHIRQDSRLIQLTSERLKDYPKLLKVFKDLKDHLDKYSSHLVKKDNPSVLMLIAYQALNLWNRMLGLQNPSENRDKECAQIYNELDQSLKTINLDPIGITYAALCDVQEIMHRLKAKSKNALRGITNTSDLHDKTIKLVDEFDEQLKANKDKIIEQQTERIKQQDEKIEQQDKQIEKINLTRSKEIIEAEAKQEKFAIENNELKTKNADLKMKLEEAKTELKETKMELNDMKEKQATVEETLCELRAQNEKINRKLNSLLKKGDFSDLEVDVFSDSVSNVNFFGH